MKRITLIAIATIFAVILFGVSSFAANNIASDAAHGIGNVVGGMTNGIRNGISAVGNTLQGNDNDTMTTRNNNNNEPTGNNNRNGAMTTDTNNGGYNANRTATTRAATTRMGTTTSDTFLGMNATAWGWFIMAVVGIVTVALVWYYGKERETSYNHDDNY